LPQVVIELTPSFPVISGQEVLLHAVADSFADIVGLSLSFDGNPVTLDEYGRGRVVAQGLGKHTVTATAVDADGLVGTTSTVIRVKDTNDKQAPSVALDVALFGARLSTATAIRGSVFDVNLDQWRLEIARQGSEDFTILAENDIPVSTGTLASIDPATLSNGFYRLRLVARDYASRSQPRPRPASIYIPMLISAPRSPGIRLISAASTTPSAATSRAALAMAGDSSCATSIYRPMCPPPAAKTSAPTTRSASARGCNSPCRMASGSAIRSMSSSTTWLGCVTSPPPLFRMPV
jgi:hypothetical protein